MADTKRYQVLSACVIVPVDGPDGTIARTLYRGMVFDGDPTNPKVAHNVDSGYVAEVGADAAVGVDAAGTPLVDDKPTQPQGGDPRPDQTQPAKKATAAKRGGRDEDLAGLRVRAKAAGLDPAEVDKASEQDLRAALKE